MGQESTEHGQIIPISTWLFSGRLEPLVGLPEKKEKKLAEICPDKFRGDNAWSNYAMQHLSNIIDMANWKWKSNDAAERLRRSAISAAFSALSICVPRTRRPWLAGCYPKCLPRSLSNISDKKN